MRKLRTDKNQKEIVQFLKDSDISYVDLHSVGKGCPDLLVCINKQNVLVEIKTKKGTLNDRQRSFHSQWEGNIEIVYQIHDIELLLKKYNYETTI